MLQSIRDKSQGLIVGFIVFLISLTFALFGIQSYFTGQDDVTVAEVDSQKIKLTALLERIKKLRQQTEEELGIQPNPEIWSSDLIKSQTLNLMIDEVVLNQVIDESGIRVSDESIVSRIKDIDAFYDESGARKPWTFDSIKVFNEYWPNPDGGLSPDQTNQMGIFFKQSWGDVDIFGLDTRFHRDDTREQMLGRAQMDWIKRELSASEATFKFILSGSIFAGGANDHEKWPHFEADLNELFSHIWGQQIGGVILMSGDIHISSILEHRNPNQPNDPYIIYEVISSGLANYGPSDPSSDDYGSIIQMRYMPPFVYDRRRTTVFALVETNSSLPDPTLSVQFIDEYGNSACSDCPFVIQRSTLGPQ